jgi:hypothetical protein
MINKFDKKEIETKESILKSSKKTKKSDKEDFNNKVVLKEESVRHEIEIKDNQKTKENVLQAKSQKT